MFDFWHSGSKLNENILFLNNGINAWYQNEIPNFSADVHDTANKIKKYSELLDCNEIIMVGVSMGGYAAILFGCLLNAKVLAFSFDTVLKHRLSRSAKRMPKTVPVVCKSLRQLIINSDVKITALSGEMDFSDLLSISRIADLKNVDAYTLRGVSHGVGRFLDKHYGMTEILEFFIEKNKLPIIKEQGELCHNKILSKSIFQAYEAYINKDYNAAKSFATKSLNMDPLCEPASYLLGLIEMELKKYTKAIQCFAYICGMLPYFSTARFNLAKCLRLAKLYTQAIHHYYEYILIRPDSPGAHYSLSLIYEIRNEKDKALAMAEKAMFLAPDNELYINHYQKMHGKEEL